jgi:GTP-binding protein
VLGRRIAKVSGTPGKTRMMNVFHISGLGVGGPGPGTPDPGPLTPFYFLDLPGYGYARASQTERVAFRHLVEYALRRSRLTGAVWLLDLRHEPSADDRAIQDLLAAAGTRVLAVATKADKLPRRQRQRREGDLRETLQVDAEQFLVTSAKTGEGIVELREAIAGLIGREHEANG